MSHTHTLFVEMERTREGERTRSTRWRWRDDAFLLERVALCRDRANHGTRSSDLHFETLTIVRSIFALRTALCDEPPWQRRISILCATHSPAALFRSPTTFSGGRVILYERGYCTLLRTAHSIPAHYIVVSNGVFGDCRDYVLAPSL